MTDDDVQDLSGEIAAARHVLRRLMAEVDDLKTLVPGVSRLVAVVVQAVRTQHALAGPEEDDWLGAADAALQAMKRQGEGEHDTG